MFSAKQKLPWLLFALAFLFLCSGCRDDGENYRTNNSNKLILRLAETQASGTPSGKGVREFARLVEQKTAGRIKIKIYYSGQLGQEDSVLEQLRFGGIDLARISLASLEQQSSQVKMATLPFLISSQSQLLRIADGQIGKTIMEELLKEKIVCLTWYDGGSRIFYNTRREIKGVADYQGLKIGIQHSPRMIELYNYLGASTLPVALNEQYRALQSGMIDGVDDSLANYYVHRHYEVAKHLLYDSQSRIPEVLVASRVSMMQLPRQDQEHLAQAARESRALQVQAWSKLESEAFARLREMGVLIQYPDAASKNGFMAVLQPLYNNFRAADLQNIIQY